MKLTPALTAASTSQQRGPQVSNQVGFGASQECVCPSGYRLA